jgi:hypothetical protein
MENALDWLAFLCISLSESELNRQGTDEGMPYRLTIFPTNDDQAGVAKAYIPPVRFRACVAGADRYLDRAGPDVTIIRTSWLKIGLPVYLLQRSAENRQSEAAVSRALPLRPGAGPRRVLVECVLVEPARASLYMSAESGTNK